jgi:hypothetical protein
MIGSATGALNGLWAADYLRGRFPSRLEIEKDGAVLVV